MKWLISCYHYKERFSYLWELLGRFSTLQGCWKRKSRVPGQHWTIPQIPCQHCTLTPLSEYYITLVSSFLCGFPMWLPSFSVLVQKQFLCTNSSLPQIPIFFIPASGLHSQLCDPIHLPHQYHGMNPKSALHWLLLKIKKNKRVWGQNEMLQRMRIAISSVNLW